MIRDVNLISNVKPSLGSVLIANGDSIPITGVGNLKFFDKDSEALYMPSFTSNFVICEKSY